MKRLKQRWGISSNFQLIIIILVFSITGSSSIYLAKPVLDWLGIEKINFSYYWWSNSLYWVLRILFIFPIYQVLLIIYGSLLGQFRFFWAFEKKMLNRIGLGFLIK